MLKAIFLIDVRVCKTLEFCRDEFISVDEILELFRSDHSEKENRCSGSTESPSLSRNAIGRIVHDVWGSIGVRSKKAGKRGEKSTHGYINLRKKDKCSQDSQGELTVSLLDTVEKEVDLENWTAIRNGIDSLSFVRYEKWAFNVCALVSPYTEHEMPLEHTIIALFPLFVSSLTMLLTTNDFPVPACPLNNKLWPAVAVSRTAHCSLVSLKWMKCISKN